MRIKNIKDYFLFGEWYHVHWMHSSFVHGLTLAIKRELGVGLSQVVFEQDKHIFRCYMSKSEWKDLGRGYLKVVLDDPEKLEDILSRIRKSADELIKLSHQIGKKKIDSLDKKETIDILKDYHKLHHSLWSLGMVPNVLEMQQSFLTDYLKKYLKKKGLSNEELLDVFQVLVLPREKSMAQKQEFDMLELAKKGDRKALKRHHEKYKWLTFGWIGPDADYSFFENQFNDLTKNKLATRKLEEFFARHDRLLENKDKYIKKLSITPEYQELFRLQEELLFLKAHRMDALYFSYSSLWPILKKIAKDNHLSMKQIYGLYIPELIKSLESGKFDVNKINDVLNYSVRYYDGVNTKLYTGAKARKVVSRVKSFLITEKFKDFFTGECAWPGRVKGVVKIINQASEMDKLQKGEILVSNITDPSLLPAMKKASAFVTNSGGLTCHAAIVARELKIPCVVGTRIATQTLKDGDMVEVDARQGIVRIIKN